ncbi:hypothetical protein [Candidatus Carsonella ruddii]|uniref:Uncharacterized protein n=1 Tax=Candidatus Carsonella ruddii HC isolate Thao2000 TaxID=1202538 RepID=J3TW24_CARRU|nr:hypothetical protein [Candidatus Carsonella ruddii]AFP83885.1 hypothetical protein A353_031 [Candidatus Carsonella ruddii HC isolate Thao2000]
MKNNLLKIFFKETLLYIKKNEIKKNLEIVFIIFIKIINKILNCMKKNFFLKILLYIIYYKLLINNIFIFLYLDNFIENKKKDNLNIIPKNNIMENIFIFFMYLLYE